MTTDKTPATLATVKHGGCVQLGGSASQIDADTLWWLQDAANTLAEGGNESHATKLHELHAALSAQPSPGGRDALDCIGRIEEAIEFRVPHDIYAAVHGELAELKAALAARQPGVK
ncbi:TPA: hypothetical protein ACOD97_000213 [Stenotrophomonas maltophilia]